ncbi:DUF4340 domain-containing protein [Pseudomonas sp. UL073]|uniref:DUF4340 domain-containing protein n=1 Tax=Zestomonas insulae TaxID=2809017 RepID=A0ABS2IC37_9GAMM|nr:DUF4340 domain-containing protein [Pseudomonas insulae]MBM7059864.1 DUF4340 domain-containing protein [Pseudomonas insulae]
MGRKSLVVLALIAALLAAGYFWLQRTPEAPPAASARAPLLPSLQGRVAEVSAIEVDSPTQPAVKLERQGANWVVPAKAGYPAAPSAVGALLRALVEARQVEAKTSNPQLHAQLGLAEQGEQRATRISLALPDNPALALLVGKPAQQGGGQLVRLLGDNQVWLIDKPISLPLEELQWLDRRVAAIDFASIQQIELRYANGQTLTVYRDKAEEPNFRVKQLPADTKVQFEAAANGMANLFGRLDFADAAPLAQIRFGEAPLLSFELRTFAGGQAKGALYGQGEQVWLTLPQRDGLSAEVLPGKPDWAYRIETQQADALTQAAKKLLGK